MKAVFDRRQFLRFGTVALGGFALPDLVAASASRPPRARARACILLYMDGGPSHIDLWDLKPEAPAEIRGPFQPIATSVPGIQVSELLPLTARQMHLLAQIRSVKHSETIHDPAVYQMLTGHKHIISAGDLKVQPTDLPQLGTIFGTVNRDPSAMPKVVEVPETMKMGGRILPGQNAGILGSVYDPFRVTVTPEAQVVPPEFAPRGDVSPSRLARRATLLEQVNQRAASLQMRAELTVFDRFQTQAFRLLTTPEVQRAFELEREPAALREHYGWNRHGQSVLLARRLVEAGSRFVTVYWGKEKQNWGGKRGVVLANNPWDTHRNHFPLVKDELAPRADRALAALVADLKQRGSLDEILVVWMGDFGRTPRIDREFASRDHWPHANTVLLAGAGVPGGAVLGRTDRHAAEVIDHPVSPADLAATILHLLGIDPRGVLHDAQGRPFPISTGTPIAALLA